ncbi:hypothetical protein MKZ38_007347 [Zalerion maritima]|uniref:Uncharacterized protein n=1 Tax=Zalerion maritima TaxID=339359 RepID=A0AAD5RVQ6_9PEZI|nr:hypothetical protein MKZ38_007347 [Zalerion maritima]
MGSIRKDSLFFADWVKENEAYEGPAREALAAYDGRMELEEKRERAVRKLQREFRIKENAQQKEELGPIIPKLPGYWLEAMANRTEVGPEVGQKDHLALEKLEDIHIVFEFGDNDVFENKALVKTLGSKRQEAGLKELASEVTLGTDIKRKGDDLVAKAEETDDVTFFYFFLACDAEISQKFMDLVFRAHRALWGKTGATKAGRNASMAATASITGPEIAKRDRRNDLEEHFSLAEVFEETPPRSGTPSRGAPGRRQCSRRMLTFA